MGLLGALLIIIIGYFFLTHYKGGGSTTTTTTTPGTSGTNKKTTTTKGKSTTTPNTTTSAPSSGKCTGGNWDCITHPERLTVKNCNVTITGTVLSGGDGKPHFAPDGDLVFPFMPDPQYKNLLTSANNDKKYGGGLWIEGVCQKPNKATEARHQGDCKCNATKFTTPKVGQKLRISGAHVIDNAEGGHAEIHPCTSIQAIGSAGLAETYQGFSAQYYSQIENHDYTKIRLSNLLR